MIYYTADPHYGHANVIKHAKRPFADVHAMDAAMIAATQAVVTAKDDLWIVGDFAWSEEAGRRAFAQLPGRKHFIQGNHDRPWVRKLGWASFHDRDIVEVRDNGTVFVLCHYPLITWNKIRHGVIHLFGHVHNNWEGNSKAINVGVDQWGFAPTTKDAILGRLPTLPANPLWEQVEPGLN